MEVGGAQLWLDHVDSWPDGFSRAKVRVTGVLEERFDLPVFEDRPDEPKKSGIPVPPGTDLKKASHRYVIASPKWERLERE